MIAYLSEQREKCVQSTALVAYREVVEEMRCNQRNQEQSDDPQVLSMLADLATQLAK